MLKHFITFLRFACQFFGFCLSNINYTALKRTQEFVDVKELLKQIMELVAQELSSNWDDPRYSRETADE